MTRIRQGQARLPLLRASIAGIAAGVIATAVQMACWWGSGLAPMEMVLRDSRLAAAIVLGPAVLPPPLDFSWGIMMAAGTLHFLLSAIYGVAQSPLAVLRSNRLALCSGAAFGALLFLINMYVFTGLYPWFGASRDLATLVAHLAFGLSAVWLTRRPHLF